MQPCCMTSALSHIASVSLIKNPKSQIYFLLLYLIFQREVRQGSYSREELTDGVFVHLNLMEMYVHSNVDCAPSGNGLTALLGPLSSPPFPVHAPPACAFCAGIS